MASEIMQVTDGTRLPVIADKVNMPYSTAVVTEVLRMGNVAPLSLPHVTSQDITVAGYSILKDTTLILSSFTHDAEMFPNPHKFDPGRYINSEGFLTGQEKVLAFSLGKRSCLGESLAIMELFLFLTSLVQRYKFFMKDSSNPPSLKGIFGLTYSPKPYQLVASKHHWQCFQTQTVNRKIVTLKTTKNITEAMFSFIRIIYQICNNLMVIMMMRLNAFARTSACLWLHH
uniref:Cytochrome P450 2D20 n=1 Tax=Magallana gigas TaxID=29159 RepID=K1RHH8_MAGGI